ncbi:hypothetical protein P4O66_020353, partial [Electrophorus voltai]
ERPRGGFPLRLWADPSSLTGESAEGKGLRRSCWLHPTALFLVIMVLLGPPRPRFNSLRPPPRNSWGCSPSPPEKTWTAVVILSPVSWDPGSSAGVPIRKTML